ncbi:MAG: hypothetical protein SFX73_17790 [Kofleriaceae bacterium]|nr:hypothetical protein [Kofleriaceae bacterium]
MKKKSSKHRPKARATRHRNATAGLASTAPPRARSRSSRSASAPHWKTIAAAVAGGAGSAALGGLVVNQQILSPEAVGIGLMLGGGATAYFSEGIPRVVGTSVAAAGAGQFALATMNKRAIKAHAAANANVPAPQPAQLPPPPPVAPRSASSGGFVVDAFQQAASDLDVIEDEWRYGIRDDAYGIDTGEPIVIDLDDAA